MGRRGITPIRNYKKFIKSFYMHKIYFFLQFSFLDLIYSLGGYNRIKPTPGDHEYNFKKVGAILCGCNTK